MQDLTEAMKRLMDIREDLEAIYSNFPGLYQDFIHSLGKSPKTETKLQLVEHTVRSLRETHNASDQDVLDWFLHQNPESSWQSILDNTDISSENLQFLLYDDNVKPRNYLKTTTGKELAKWCLAGDKEVKFQSRAFIKSEYPILTGIDPPPKKKSNRDLVREAGAEPSNIQQLADKSGLTKAQVRGVINAPDEKDDWEREEDDSGLFEVLYSYRPADMVIKTASGGVVRAFKRK